MERGNPPQAGRMQGARSFGYFWRGRPSGQLPKVTRRKGGTVRPGRRLSQRLGTGLREKFRLMSSLDNHAGMRQPSLPPHQQIRLGR